VKSSTSDTALYSETGRYPLCIGRKINTVKYWLKLVKNYSGNCILQEIYNTLCKGTRRHARNWTSNVKFLLQTNGFGDVWEFPNSVSNNVFIPILLTRLKDTFIVECRNGMNIQTSLSLYKELHDNFEMAFYLRKLLNPKHRHALSKLRLSSHPLLIEQGRHHRPQIQRQNRLCSLCNTRDIEDEFHFVLKCSVYHELRTQYIPRYYQCRPSMVKFIGLLNSTNVGRLRNLSIYVTKALKQRQDRLTVQV